MKTSSMNKLVPPTKFHYYIISEAYLGYRFRSAIGLDGKETSAIMGGAVMAGLTAWGDKTVREVFFRSGVISYMDVDVNPKSDVDWFEF